MAQARSGAPHFHTRPGARSGALAHFHFAAAHSLPKFGVSTPPPPGTAIRCLKVSYTNFVFRLGKSKLYGFRTMISIYEKKKSTDQHFKERNLFQMHIICTVNVPPVVQFYSKCLT